MAKKITQEYVLKVVAEGLSGVSKQLKELNSNLTGMPENHSQDVCDLLITGTEGGIEFDYIVDPTAVICDGGDYDTICWINTTHYLNNTFTSLNATNLIINSSGKLLNHTTLNFLINLTGNLTIEEGGVIGLNGSSCSSGTCVNGGNFSRS